MADMRSNYIPIIVLIIGIVIGAGALYYASSGKGNANTSFTISKMGIREPDGKIKDQ